MRHLGWLEGGRSVLAGLASAVVLTVAALGPVAAPAVAAESSENTRQAPLPAAWARTTKEATLWSGPDDKAKEFGKIAAGTTLQVIEMTATRAFVYFAGDKQGHPAGEVWINRSDLATASWPQWLRARRSAEIRPEPAPAGPGTIAVSRGSYVETTGETRGRWARVFYLGDGRLDGAIEGWIDSADFALPSIDQTTLTSYLVSKGLLASREPDVWLRVPYRTQLDGSEYAAANCGPTSVGMVLESFGQVYGQELLRTTAMQLQDTVGCDECGVFVQNLATMVEARDARVYGLRKDGAPARPITETGMEDNDNLRRWTLDDVRTELRVGRVVVPQVKFRYLPGRASSAYGGDHFVVITGMIGDRFVYNDPIDSDGRGYARMISADALERAMALASVPKAAFAVGS